MTTPTDDAIARALEGLSWAGTRSRIEPAPSEWQKPQVPTLINARAAQVARLPGQRAGRNPPIRTNQAPYPAGSSTKSFILRRIDRALWVKVKAKAARERVSIKTLIERLLAEWVAS